MPYSQHDEDATPAADDAPIPITLVPTLSRSLHFTIMIIESFVWTMSSRLSWYMTPRPTRSALLWIILATSLISPLLFMGAKKFLIENKYGQYLSANSGSSNAYTRPTSTNYFFDISAKPDNDQDPSDNNLSLREALDRFAQFFIEPLSL
ncbi:hypothetical protein BFJ69_g15651 [Fusarium oxysporum]|uniref:Peptidase M16 N-terminal domain-containing protein n=1 Tax=Fusarium oxysporum TaxID=5507 RepID=A0A420MDL6_FUSOX|nr:hypothetical protein BFJ69_g15651 [Fusarium oxysporum]